MFQLQHRRPIGYSPDSLPPGPKKGGRPPKSKSDQNAEAVTAPSKEVDTLLNTNLTPEKAKKSES